ncbi:MAG: hypothetical protein RLY49_576 [Candidatus Parcubacteria bacterium]
MKKITKISEAQKFVENFAKNNKWSDKPNIDKFDHLHEELIEMSKHLRYKKSKEMSKYIKENLDTFEDGIGDLFFALCRLSNQLGINVEKSFNLVTKRIEEKYKKKVNLKNYNPNTHLSNNISNSPSPLRESPRIFVSCQNLFSISSLEYFSRAFLVFE